MKISTLRKLLITVDVMLVFAVGLVVWRGIQDKKTYNLRHREYQQEVIEQLRATRSDLASRQAQLKYGENIMAAHVAGKTAKPEVPIEVAPQPTESAKPPLRDTIHLLGAVIGSPDGDPPSMAYLTKRGTPITDGMLLMPFYVVGQVVEFAHGATIKRIEEVKLPGQGSKLQVVFDYNGKEEALIAETSSGTPGTLPPTGDMGRGGGGSIASALVTDDPGGWVMMPPGNPNQITVTPTGVRSISEKGEIVLDGVRWSSEVLSDGQPAVRIDTLPQSNVLARGGAQEGDVLEAINGVRVRSKAEIINYVRSQPNLGRYEVTFRRKGLLHRRTVTVPRN